MKKWYLFIIIFGIGTLVLSAFLLSDLNNVNKEDSWSTILYNERQIFLSKFFIILTGLFEITVLGIGFWAYKRLGKLSLIMIISSIFMLVFSIPIFNYPSYFNIEVVILFWTIYIIGTIYLNILAFNKHDKNMDEFQDDGILDSGI